VRIRKAISFFSVCGLALFAGCSDKTSSDSSTNSSNSTVPQTTTPSIPFVETNKILGAICTTVPKDYKATGGDLYGCERNGSRITMQVNGPAELAAFTNRFPTVKLIETQLLCGNGWKLNFQKPDYSPGDAGILYQLLSKVGIQAESCS